MTTHDVVEAYEARLNKSDSQDYDNIWWYQIENSFYKATIDVIRRLKKGKTQKQESDEETTDATDDLQVLLNDKPYILSCVDKGLYSLSGKLPSNYLYYKRLSPKCSKGKCSGIYIKSNLREEGNVDDLLQDEMNKPSFDFEQTFHVLSNNRFKIYHNKDFDIDQASLIYYRLPTKYKFDRDKEYTIEFKDDLVNLFIDEGVKIIASDIQDFNTVQTSDARTKENG